MHLSTEFFTELATPPQANTASLLADIIVLVFVQMILISPMSAGAFPSIRTLRGALCIFFYRITDMKRRSYTYTFHGSLQPEDVLMHYHQKLLFVPNSCHVGQILALTLETIFWDHLGGLHQLQRLSTCSCSDPWLVSSFCITSWSHTHLQTRPIFTLLCQKDKHTNTCQNTRYCLLHPKHLILPWWNTKTRDTIP